jgi:HK97 family phage prohead protease
MPQIETAVRELPQAQDYVRRPDGLRLCSFDEATRSVEVVASSDALDSYDEIVEQKWRLDRFASNPVVLFAHQSRELPIGRAEDYRMDSQKLKMRLFLATAEANPVAEQVWQLMKQRILRGVSVGFRPHEVRVEMRDGRDVYVLSDNELMEVSVVPVPANPEGLVMRGLSDEQRAMAKKSRKPTATPEGDDMEDENKKQLEAANKIVAERQAAAEIAEKEVASLRERVASLFTSNTELSQKLQAQLVELDSLRKEKAALEHAAAERDVDALVGVKITAAQREDYLELRIEKGKEKFDSFVAKHADLHLTNDVTGEDTNPTKNTATRTGLKTSVLLAKANEAANRAAGAK